METILETKLNYSEDNSIKSYEIFSYQPITGTKLDDPGEIVIRIENQDAFFYPRKSWLQIEGKLEKAAGGAYLDTQLIALTNNALMFLFDNMKYELSGQEIESLYYPGHASTMLGMLKYYNNKSNSCWMLDTSTDYADTNLGFKERRESLMSTTPTGLFRFSIDLEHIFGFCEDYNRVMYGFVHCLTLVRRANSDNAIFRDGVNATEAKKAGAGKVEITKIAWMMPKIQPNDEKKLKLYKSIESKETLEVGFRMRQCSTVSLATGIQAFTWRLGVRSIPEKPRYMVIAFQTNKSTQLTNASTFDHCKLANIFILLNNVRYPAIDYHADFVKNHYENLYKNLADFREKFYGIDSLISTTNVTHSTYKSLFPLFVFDVSKQSERLNQGVVDIIVEMSFGAPILDNTFAYAVLISDRKIKFQSNGKKMNVIY